MQLEACHGGWRAELYIFTSRCMHASSAHDPCEVDHIVIHDITQLEAFLGRWRAELAPTHSFVFTARNGAPLTMQGVHRIFTSTCYRLASPRTPSFIRPSAAFAKNM